MPAIIGITTSQITNQYGQPTTLLTEAYSRAILQAGGVPVLIPSVLDAAGRGSVFAHLDGILFSGGGDIHPRQFAAPPHAAVEDVEDDRDLLELDLLNMSASARKPFLGICRGCQLVNVGLGGTLYTHLPDEPGGPINHKHPGNEHTVLVHRVKLESGMFLSHVLGEADLMVNSHHHQGLKDLAPAVRVAGRAEDGLVEAIEIPDHPFGLAVQWHPEWLTDQQPTRNLFQRFVESAARFR
jgi:putative glutamine amidotransferase